ncbi:MAG: hypothetical protein P8020_07505 [Acidobacteriota bacterium]|jgi:hypothetical protein
MKVSGHGFLEHVQLLTPLFGVIGAVWALRFILGEVGAPMWLIEVFSVGVFVPICVILAALLIHLKRFGGYASVVLSSFLLVLWGQVLIVFAISLSVAAGVENIYTAPQFSIPGDIGHVRHIVGHLTFGVGLETLIGSLMGCLILFMLRRAKPPGRS